MDGFLGASESSVPPPGRRSMVAIGTRSRRDRDAMGSRWGRDGDAMGTRSGRDGHDRVAMDMIETRSRRVCECVFARGSRTRPSVQRWYPLDARRRARRAVSRVSHTQRHARAPKRIHHLLRVISDEDKSTYINVYQRISTYILNRRLGTARQVRPWSDGPMTRPFGPGHPYRLHPMSSLALACGALDPRVWVEICMETRWGSTGRGWTVECGRNRA